MPTVDDLIISLRIDETSNLGKLQKQLTALVGKDGSKGISLGGFGGVTKTDLNFIKNKLMELSPITLGRENKQVKETVKTTIRQLQRREIQDMLIAKYGMKKEEIKSWIAFMGQELKDNEANISDLSGLVREIHMAIFGAEGKGGPQKTSLTAIRKRLPERFMQRTLEEIMKDMGEWYEGQYQVYEIDKEKIQKYRAELDTAISDKAKEIKDLKEGAVEITEKMKESLIKLSQDTRDSDEFVKDAVRDILNLGTDSAAIIEKLRIGATDPILEFLALIRSKSAEKITGMTLVENLKDLLPKFKESLMEPGPAKMDIKITKSLVQKILDNAEEIGVKVHDFGGALDALKDQPEILASELKNIWNKTEIKRDLKHDKRVKETGKDFFVLMGIASTVQGIKELKKEAESSEAKAKYLYLEFLPRMLAKEMATRENIDELLDETGVYDNVDKVFTGMEQIKGDITKLIQQQIKEDPENIKKVLNELFGLDEHITEIAENEEAILSAIEGKTHEKMGEPPREEED